MKKICIILGVVILIIWVSPSLFAGDIHIAVKKGDLKRVIELLDTNESLLDAREKIGHTPLSLAAAYGQWEIFRYLLEKGADVNNITLTNTTPMHAACFHDKPDMIELLFQYGGAKCLQKKDIFGEYTPMLRAVQCGNNGVISLLFEKGANPEEKTKEGWNALHLASICGHRHLYGLLIDNGVSLDEKDLEGKKPMEYDFKRPEIISVDTSLLREYKGRYTWEGKPDNPGVDVFIMNGILILDDYAFNELYPIGRDVFYCTKNPWKIRFIRKENGQVVNVELCFLRQNVILNKLE